MCAVQLVQRYYSFMAAARQARQAASNGSATQGGPPGTPGPFGLPPSAPATPAGSGAGVLQEGSAGSGGGAVAPLAWVAQLPAEELSVLYMDMVLVARCAHVLALWFVCRCCACGGLRSHRERSSFKGMKVWGSLRNGTHYHAFNSGKAFACDPAAI